MENEAIFSFDEKRIGARWWSDIIITVNGKTTRESYRSPGARLDAAETYKNLGFTFVIKRS